MLLARRLTLKFLVERYSIHLYDVPRDENSDHPICTHLTRKAASRSQLPGRARPSIRSFTADVYYRGQFRGE
jgi:hypothetical protein